MAFVRILRAALVTMLCVYLVQPFFMTASAQTAKTPVPKAVPAPLTASKNVHPATFVSADDSAVQVKIADGTALDAAIHPTSLFLLDGVAAKPTDFKPGAKVILRTRVRASDGAVSVVMLCDLATSNAIEAYRRKPLVGNVVNADDKTLVVKPEGPGGTLLTLRVTAKTLYRKGNADATAAAFPAGAGVAVITRGLPSGILMASIVSDKIADAVTEKNILKPISLVGIAADVQPDKSLLTVAPKTKPRQTIAVGDATKITVDKTPGTLRQITQGMRVSARMGHQKDAAGHLVATSVSAYTALPAPARKKTAAAPKKP